jgi:hypothetical protein
MQGPALAPAQRAVVARRRLAGEFTAEALLEQLRAIAGFDADNDARRQRYGGFAIAAFVAVVICLFLAIPFGRAALVVALAAFVAAIVLGVLWKRLAAADISDNVRDVALPFLAIVKQDLAPGAMVSVDLDLAPATDAAKRTGVSPPYARGSYTKVVDTSYRDAWFSGSARLADASVLRWHVVDEVIESKRSKRSRSNKWKTKTHEVKRSAIAVSVALPTKTYAVAAGAAKPNLKLALAADDKRTTVKLVRKIKAKDLDPIDPRALIDTVAEAYRRVTPARSATP